MIASPRQLAYAPTPYSYTPNTSLSATINLDQVHPYLIIPPPASCIASLIPQITSAHAKSIRSPKKEVKLSETAAERDLQDSLAEIYSIIITLDGLEKAYIKDSIPETEYTELCNRLLKQYKSNLNDENVARAFVDLETFKREWDIECPRATERLRVNLPSTVTDPTPAPSSTPHHNPYHHPPPSSSTPLSTSAPGAPPTTTTTGPTTASGSQILTATENFITVLDALKLNMLSKDALHPLLAELIQSVNEVTRDFEGRGKIINWLIRLNGMRAQEELGEGEARELGFEMEGAYRGFKGTLS